MICQEKSRRHISYHELPQCGGPLWASERAAADKAVCSGFAANFGMSPVIASGEPELKYNQESPGSDIGRIGDGIKVDMRQPIRVVWCLAMVLTGGN